MVELQSSITFEDEQGHLLVQNSGSNNLHKSYTPLT
jgi:hypothetical protein